MCDPLYDDLKCPACGATEGIFGVEYDGMDPNHYDGISEWACQATLWDESLGAYRLCDTRWGRWSGRVLARGEAEPNPHRVRKESAE